MKRYHTLALALVASIGLAACGGDGDDATGPTGDELSEPEAEALAAVIANEALGFGLGEIGGAEFAPEASSAAEPEEIDIPSFSFEENCELGGTVAITMSYEGVVDYDTGFWDLTWDFVQAHDGCGVAHDGHEFTLTGDPDISMTWDMEVDESQSFDISGQYGGAVEWTVDDGRSGRCTVDVSFSATGDWSTGSGTTTVNGHVCGVDVSSEITV